MTNTEVAARLISLCTAGEFLQAQEELYHADISSIETDGSKTNGAANMHEKEKAFLSRLDKINFVRYSEPQFAGSYFSVVLTMSIDLKGAGSFTFAEVCVYQVKEGKIVFEQFFRD